MRSFKFWIYWKNLAIDWILKLLMYLNFFIKNFYHTTTRWVDFRIHMCADVMPKEFLFCDLLRAYGLKHLINMYNLIIFRLYAFVNIDGLCESIKWRKTSKEKKIIFIYDINVVVVMYLICASLSHMQRLRFLEL